MPFRFCRLILLAISAKQLILQKPLQFLVFRFGSSTSHGSSPRFCRTVKSNPDRSLGGQGWVFNPMLFAVYMLHATLEEVIQELELFACSKLSATLQQRGMSVKRLLRVRIC